MFGDEFSGYLLDDFVDLGTEPSLPVYYFGELKVYCSRTLHGDLGVRTRDL